MGTDGSDLRQAPRIPFVLRVHFPDRAQVLSATENLSQGGLFIQTDRVFELGDQVPVSLSFPGLIDPVEIVGKVAWIRKGSAELAGGVGLKVERDADRKRLEALLTPEAAPQPSEGYRILIVEDNPHIIEMYSYVLKKLASGDLGGKVPFEVHFAPDGHSALKQLLETRFNLVMTDLYMPVMDGFALVERIRTEEKLKSMPVIVISAGGKDAQDKALALGVDIYLRKPVKFAEVLDTVKQILRINTAAK